MADKEIIIDGVDVSECEYQYYENCKIDYEEWNGEIIRYNKCRNSPNCYFKQLKRKEQEFEELKKIKEENVKLVKEVFDKDRYIERLVVELNDIQDNCPCFKDCSYRQCDKDRIANYKQALDEIMENIKAINNECFYRDVYECDDCDMRNGCSYYRKSKIRDIINKTKENEYGNRNNKDNLF